MGEAAQVLGRELRRLRQEQGLSQRALTKLLGLTAHSNIADYESGRRIPPRDIISSCDRLLETDGGLGRLLTRALAEKALGEAPPPPPLRRRRHLVTIVALAIPVIGLLAWSLPRSGHVDPSPSPSPSPSTSIWDGNDPKAAGCAADAVSLQAQPLFLANGQQLGAVHLRYSPGCHAAWAKFEPLAVKPPGSVVVTVEAVRPSDGMRTMFQVPGWDQVYGDILRTGPGCVIASATLRLADGAEATASTACLTA